MSLTHIKMISALFKFIENYHSKIGNRGKDNLIVHHKLGKFLQFDENSSKIEMINVFLGICNGTYVYNWQRHQFYPRKVLFSYSSHTFICNFIRAAPTLQAAVFFKYTLCMDAMLLGEPSLR